MSRSAVLIVAVLLALPGCGGDDEETDAPRDTATATTTTETAPTWNGPTLSAEGASVDVDAFNSYVSSVGGELARSPRAQAEAFPGKVGASTMKSVEAKERGDRAEATVTLEGLEDDSVRALRWELDFARTGEVWTLTSARFSQRCHEGRGHQDYSPELCI